MRIAALGSRLTGIAALGWIAAPAQAEAFIPCSPCRIVGQAAPFHAERAASSRWRALELSFPQGASAAKGLTDHVAARFFGSGDDGFTIETRRRVAKRSYTLDRSGPAREKLSSGALLLHYDERIGDGDMLSLGLSGSFEKRRFALDLSDGHMSHSRSLGIEGGWSHGANWRLTAGYRADMGGTGRSELLRGIELAEGATRTQHGGWMAISFTPGAPGTERAVSFGIKAQAMLLSDRDRLALGAPAGHDNRIGFVASVRFR